MSDQHTDGPLLLTLDYHEMEQPGTPKPDRDHYAKRFAARAVVLDATGAVGLLHAKEKDYYKLAGGGVEANETPTEALHREIKEELGCEVEIGEMLGHVLEYRDFWEIEQTSECYIARVKGEKGEPNLTAHEVEEKFEIFWAKDIATALQLVESSDTSTFPNVVFMSRRDAAVLKKAAEVNPQSSILPNIPIPNLPNIPGLPKL